MKKLFAFLLLIPALAFGAGGSGFPTAPRLGAHCTSIYASILTTTSLPSDGAKYQVNLDTVDYDPDGMADTVNSQIKIPSWSHHAQVFGHVYFPTQSVGQGTAGVHLWKNHAATTVYYQNRIVYPWTNPNTVDFPTAISATSDVVPATPGDTWQLYASQSSGGTVTLNSGINNWLAVCFYR